MLKLKGCPRCKTGDVHLDRDYYGWYEYCIQCGYMHDLESMVKSGQQQACDGKEEERGITTLNEGK